MRILYSAIDQIVPGTTGGSVHVAAVAEGLARRGHEVHVLAARGSGRAARDPEASGPTRSGTVYWHALAPPFGVRQLRMARAARVLSLAETLRPDVVIERYYNFGGEAIRAARRLDALAVLEVNAPIIDYPGSRKALLDRAMLVEPMRRWRDWQCAKADLFVTPSREILPASIDRARVLEIEWGADIDRFRPDVAREGRRHHDPDRVVAVFAGAFRPWHGAIHLVRAVRRLRERGDTRIDALFIGEGPELPAVIAAAEGLNGLRFVGAVPHEGMPVQVARADIGVAPFDVGAHGPLALGFYWSPLKVFEYMACGLPVVAPRLPRLQAIARDGCEGVLYDPGPPDGLADALVQLLDRDRRRALGVAARARVVERFSWAAHCEQLEHAIEERLTRRRAGGPS